MAIFEKPCKPSGTMGTVSSQTLSSVGMILEGLRALQQLLKELNPSYEVDLHTCLTVQVENLHAMGHFKDQFPTLLEYAKIWQILSMRVLRGSYNGLHTTTPTRSPTIL